MKKNLLSLAVLFCVVLLGANVASAALNDADFVSLCGSQRNGTAEKIKAALDEGANVNALRRDGLTAIQLVVQQNKNPGIVTELIKKGADTKVRYKNSENTLLITAAGNNTLQTMEELIKNGADVNAKNYNGRTAMFNAVLGKVAADVEAKIALLKKNGADINAQDKGGETPLYHAAKGGVPLEVLTVLIKNGADVNVKAGKGSMTHTALTYAKNFKKPELEKFLRDNGAKE